MSLRSPAAAVALGLLLASACTSVSHVEPYVQPAQAALSVVVAPARGVRADGTVPRNERFVVQLDDYPDPDSVSYGPLTLHSGRANFDIDVSIDFVRRQVIVQPRTLMSPGVQYDLVVSGLVALDDRQQGADVVGSVLVGADDGDPFPPPTRRSWNGDLKPLVGGCAPFCHSPVGESGRMRTPTRLLDLTGDPRDPAYGMVDVTSVGLRGTPAPLYRVAPFDPARSVLLRKLIGGSPAGDSQDPPYPAMRVDGRRMPLLLDAAESSGPPFSDDDLLKVQDWILSGAPLD